MSYLNDVKTKGVLVMAAYDNYAPLHPILKEVGRYTKCWEVLDYYISQKMTGEKLYNFYVYACEGSVFALVRYALMKENRDKELPRLKYGKDYQ